MPAISISPKNNPVLPAEAVNNSWRPYRGTGSVIVFVHGVLSDSDACWRNKKAKTFWPDLVAGDKLFDGSSIFLGGYYTAFDSTDYALQDCARGLLSALIASDQHPAVMEAERLIFVCHSLGGIVTRYMLERWREKFRNKKIGLLLIASPSIGSKYANRLDRVLAALRHETGRQLQWNSPELEDLDRRFKDLVETGLIPDLMGRELCEHRFLVYYRWLAPIMNLFPPVVKWDSAGRYFGEPRRLADTNHSTSVKPSSKDHCSHQELRAFYTEVLNRFPISNWIPPADSQRFPDPRGLLLARDHSLRSGVLNWDVEINEDGDAWNDLALKRVTECRTGSEPKFQLPDMWVQSGHISQYVIDSARSSARVTLVEERVLPQLVRQTVAFHHPPSEKEPADIVLKSLDFNVYAMDVEEFQRKQTAQQDNTDFLQKTIRWEQAGVLNIVVRFPASMQLEGDVFVEAYQIFHGETEEMEVYDQQLTDQAKTGFYFSRLTRVAMLRFENPRTWTAYRIVWRLGASDPGSKIAPAQSAIIAQRRKDLRGIRALFVSNDAVASPEKINVLTAIANLGAVVVEEVHDVMARVAPDAKIKFDVGKLELNLMAVDVTGSPEHEILRSVAGTDVGLDLWEFAPAIGDGIAGRATKRLEPRSYDRSKGDKLSDGAYLAITKRHHEWLLAIPLWNASFGPLPYGVVNIGTFDTDTAKLLRVLDNPESIEALLTYANEEFVPAILQDQNAGS
jgi:pimeloyl-ACP methyl ester carboxylesterase